MIVGALLIRLHLPSSESLKDRRQVIKSLTSRLANQFGVAAAEVGEHDVWQLAELGVSYVSNESKHVESVLDSVMRYIETTRPDVDILDTQRELIPMGWPQ